MPQVLVDLCNGDGPIPAAEAVRTKPDYRDLSYFVDIATSAAGEVDEVERFVLSYFRAIGTRLTARDVWFLIGDETSMPIPERPPCPVFRTYGDRFWSPWRGWPVDPVLLASELALVARNRVRAIRTRWPRVLPGQLHAAAGWLPLGTPAADATIASVPPIADRKIDVGFRGSLGGGKRYAPRTVSRRRMVDALGRLPESVRVDLFETESFVASYERESSDYASALIDTKLCLAPRGGSFETFRTFEAALSGCVLIAEPLPPAWFYNGLPRWELRSWTTLPEAVDDLLSNPTMMQSMSDAGRRWALEVVSPAAVGRWVASRLAELSSRGSRRTPG
jgi:hypothetical protein